MAQLDAYWTKADNILHARICLHSEATWNGPRTWRTLKWRFNNEVHFSLFAMLDPFWNCPFTSIPIDAIQFDSIWFNLIQFRWIRFNSVQFSPTNRPDNICTQRLQSYCACGLIARVLSMHLCSQCACALATVSIQFNSVWQYHLCSAPRAKIRKK